MTLIFGIPLSVMSGQLLLGLINGAFYALLSLGLAIIFGLLRIINFAHGAQYMLEDGKKFDAIFVDGFDKRGRAGVLDTLPFYQACRSRLSDQGLLSVNLLSRNRGYEASKKRLDEAFESRSLVFPCCESGNTIAFATGGSTVDVSLNELIQRAKHIHKISGLNLLPTIPRLQNSGTLIGDRLKI